MTRGKSPPGTHLWEYMCVCLSVEVCDEFAVSLASDSEKGQSLIRRF